VHDLGEQNLKDIQHERVYELTVDGHLGSRPLKTQAVDSRADAMAKRFEERVTSYVEQQLEAAFERGQPPSMPVGSAAKGLGILGLMIAGFLVFVVVVILLVKLLF
jgi:hypothetical protein